MSVRVIARKFPEQELFKQVQLACVERALGIYDDRGFTDDEGRHEYRKELLDFCKYFWIRADDDYIDKQVVSLNEQLMEVMKKHTDFCPDHPLTLHACCEKHQHDACCCKKNPMTVCIEKVRDERQQLQLEIVIKIRYAYFNEEKFEYDVAPELDDE